MLVVVAHPDDETLFFAPTVLGLAVDKRRVGVLVLSNGDHEGVGGLREREMQLACSTLGLRPCIVLNDPCVCLTIRS